MRTNYSCAAGLSRKYLALPLFLLVLSGAVTCAVADQIPKGAHDVSVCEVSLGWACDPDHYSSSIMVHFYADAPHPSGIFLGEAAANTYRADIAAFCGGYANHGFSFTTPASLKDGKPHRIYAYGINLDSSDNPLLPGTPSQFFTCAAPDTAAPAVSVTAPLNGATVSGTITIAAGASDNVGVARVELYVDGILQGTLSSAPYSLPANTTLVANGVHTIQAKAWDAAGNMGASSVVSVTVNNIVQDTAPAGRHEGSDCNASPGWACDPDKYSAALTVTFYADGPAGHGTLLGSITASGLREAGVAQQCGGQAAHGFVFPTPASLKDGKTHVLYPYVGSVNGSGAVVGSVPLALLAGAPNSITCAAPDVTAPSVPQSLTAMSASSSQINLSWAVSMDNVSVAGYRISRGGVQIGTSAANSFQNAGLTPSTAYSYAVAAYDAAGNVSAQSAAAAATTLAAADNSAPIVYVGAPAGGAAVSGTIAISATASDNVGVSRVEFYIDGTLQGALTVSPYSVAADTRLVANGVHTIQAKAWDAAGNMGVSSVVSVTVNNIVPDVAPTGRHEGSDCSASPGWACDPDKYSAALTVTFYADGPAGQGTLLGSITAGDTREAGVAQQCGGQAAHGFVFPTPASLKDGKTHVLYPYVGSVNGSGAVVGSVPLALLAGAPNSITCGTVSDTAPPAVSVTVPANGAAVSGTITISAGASDNAGVARVEFYIDGTLQSTLTASPYSITADTKLVANGAHTIQAKAYDAAGNVGTSALVGVTVSNTIVADQAPKGNHDVSTCEVSLGWACDPDNYSQPVKVHFYADAPHPSGVFFGEVTADTAREDIKGMCGGYSNHGFSFATPELLKDGKEHRIYAYGINLDSNDNPLLYGTPSGVFTCGGTPSAPLSEPQYVVIRACNPGPETGAGVAWVAEMLNTIGRKGSAARRLAFSDVIYSMEMTDAQIRSSLQQYFNTSESLDLPFLVHVDFEYFWKSRPDLWNWFDPAQPGYDPENKNNVEWSDWNTPVKAHYLNWGSIVTLAPPICYESQEVREVMRQKAGVIAAEINAWRNKLAASGRDYLFAGVDAGWETGIDSLEGLDWVPAADRKHLGYCALSRRGFSAANPPSDREYELSKAVRDFAEFESRLMADNGIPRAKIYTHIWAVDDYTPHPPSIQHEHAPLSAAVNGYSRPGVSIYPGVYDAVKVRNLVQGLESWGLVETQADSADYLQLMTLGNCRLVSLYSWSCNIKGNQAAIARIQSLFPADVGAPTAEVVAVKSVPTDVPTVVASTSTTSRSMSVSLQARSFTTEVVLSLKVPHNMPAPDPVLNADMKSTGIGMEITLDQAVQPVKAATLEVTYTDAEMAGVDRSKLVLARYDEGSEGWIPLESISYPEQNKVTGKTTHFSLFQVMVLTAGVNLNGARIYPNPFYPNKGHTQVSMDGLPEGTAVKVYTLNGELVWEGKASAAGLAVWYGRNKAGRKVASGLYLVHLESGGQKKIKKVSVVK